MQTEGYSKEIEVLMHKTIKKVTNDIENLKFNTAIAALMTLVTEMGALKTLKLDDITSFITMLSPFAPHIAEEMWEELGLYNSMSFVCTQSWPKYDEEKCVDAIITIAASVNGKVRGRVEISKDATNEEAIAAAKSDPKVIESIEGKQIIKEIYVKGNLVNIVVK